MNIPSPRPSRARGAKLIIFFLVLCLLAAPLFLRGATLWAAPGTDPQRQTVPTLTPTSAKSPERDRDDDRGEAPSADTPTATSTSPPTSQPTALPSVTSTATAAAIPTATVAAPTTIATSARPERAVGWDFGDAPDPGFPSLLKSDGASHLMVEFEWLGARVDKELDSHQVDGDLYDDGVQLDGLEACQTVEIPITVTVADTEDPQHPYDEEHLLYLNVLVDWNMDGIWGGEASCPDGQAAPEWAVHNLPIDASSWPQGMTSMVVPVELVAGPQEGETWARFTLTYGQVVSGDNWDGRGSFSFGETEDHVLIVGSSGTGTTYLPLAEAVPTATPTVYAGSAIPESAGTGITQVPICPGAGLALGGGLVAIRIGGRSRSKCRTTTGEVVMDRRRTLGMSLRRWG